MKAEIDGEFVKIIWQEGGDSHELLITPKNVVNNYRSAKEERSESVNILPLLEECFENGNAGESQLYAWFLGEAELIEEAIEYHKEISA